MVEPREHPHGVSIMPSCHLALWKFIRGYLPGEVVVAGSFASAQMQNNLFGSHHGFNDIDFWYDEDHLGLLTSKKVREVIG